MHRLTALFALTSVLVACGGTVEQAAPEPRSPEPPARLADRRCQAV